MEQALNDYREEICRLYTNGYSFPQMSVMLPFGASTLRIFCNELIGEGKLEKRSSHHKREEKRKLVQEAFLLGEKNLDTLAQRFELSKASVQQYLVGLGRKDIKTEKSKAIAMALATTKYKWGTLNQISKQFGVTRAYVGYILKRIEDYL